MDVSKIKIGSTEYDIKDTTARAVSLVGTFTPDTAGGNVGTLTISLS